MNRRGQTQKGQFEVQTGMAFTMPALKTILPNGEYIEAQKHPWLIVNTDDDFIEIVMCTTLWSDKENKHRSNKLKYENVTDITNPCPPLDPPNERGSLVMHTQHFQKNSYLHITYKYVIPTQNIVISQLKKEKHYALTKMKSNISIKTYANT